MRSRKEGGEGGYTGMIMTRSLSEVTQKTTNQMKLVVNHRKIKRQHREREE